MRNCTCGNARGRVVAVSDKWLSNACSASEVISLGCHRLMGAPREEAKMMPSLEGVSPNALVFTELHYRTLRMAE